MHKRCRKQSTHLPRNNVSNVMLWFSQHFNGTSDGASEEQTEKCWFNPTLGFAFIKCVSIFTAVALLKAIVYHHRNWMFVSVSPSLSRCVCVYVSIHRGVCLCKHLHRPKIRYTRKFIELDTQMRLSPGILIPCKV